MIETWLLRISLAISISFISSIYLKENAPVRQLSCLEYLCELESPGVEQETDGDEFASYNISWSNSRPMPKFVTAYHPGLGRSSYQRCDLFTE